MKYFAKKIRLLKRGRGGHFYPVGSRSDSFGVLSLYPFSARPARALGGGWECRAERGTKSQHLDFL